MRQKLTREQIDKIGIQQPQNDYFIEVDGIHGQGFISDEARMNVAVIPSHKVAGLNLITEERRVCGYVG